VIINGVWAVSFKGQVRTHYSSAGEQRRLRIEKEVSCVVAVCVRRRSGLIASDRSRRWGWGPRVTTGNGERLSVKMENRKKTGITVCVGGPERFKWLGPEKKKLNRAELTSPWDQAWLVGLNGVSLGVVGFLSKM